MINEIKDYINKKGLKQDSAFEIIFGYLALYPLYRERKRFNDISEILQSKNISQVSQKNSNKQIRRFVCKQP